MEWKIFGVEWYRMEDFSYGAEQYGKFCLLWNMEDLCSIL